MGGSLEKDDDVVDDDVVVVVVSKDEWLGKENAYPLIEYGMSSVSSLPDCREAIQHQHHKQFLTDCKNALNSLDEMPSFANASSRDTNTFPQSAFKASIKCNSKGSKRSWSSYKVIVIVIVIVGLIFHSSTSYSQSYADKNTFVIATPDRLGYSSIELPTSTHPLTPSLSFAHQHQH